MSIRNKWWCKIVVKDDRYMFCFWRPEFQGFYKFLLSEGWTVLKSFGPLKNNQLRQSATWYMAKYSYGKSNLKWEASDLLLQKWELSQKF